MKMCPCCKGLAFDDMDRCYVCGRPFPQHTIGQLLGFESDVPVWSPHGVVGDPEPARDLSSLGEVCEYTVDSAFTDEGAGEGAAAGWTVTVGQPGWKQLVVRVPPEGGKVTVGRASDNQVRVIDLRVSRHHALITSSEGALWLRDLGSTNLTFLDGVPVVGTRKLEDGATVRIGCATLRVARQG